MSTNCSLMTAKAAVEKSMNIIDAIFHHDRLHPNCPLKTEPTLVTCNDTARQSTENRPSNGADLGGALSAYTGQTSGVVTTSQCVKTMCDGLITRTDPHVGDPAEYRCEKCGAPYERR